MAPNSGVGRFLPLVLVTIAVIVVLPSFWAPLGYDEAYNLQIVGNLLHGHGYATDAIQPTGAPREFDYHITTGPSLMLPITAATWLLGAHVWVYRLVPVFFYCVLLWCWWVLGNRSFGPWAGAAGVVGVLMIDGISLASTVPGSAVGESASTACLLVALLAIRRPGWCGLMLGLAVMTKVLILLAAPGVMVALLLQSMRSGTRRTTAMLAALTTFLVPPLIWQLVRIVSVGWSGNVKADHDFLTFLADNGAGDVGIVAHGLKQLVTLDLPGLIALLLAALTIALAGVTRHARAALQRLEPAWAGVAVGGLTLELWWLISEAQGWPRHALQATQLLLPLGLILAVAAAGRIERDAVRRVMVGAMGVTVSVQLGVIATTMWELGRPTLAQQQHVADLVASRSRVYDYVRVDSTELLLLNPSLRSRPLGSSSQGTGRILLVFNPRGDQPVHLCDPPLERYAGYVICWSTPPG